MDIFSLHLKIIPRPTTYNKFEFPGRASPLYRDPASQLNSKSKSKSARSAPPRS